MIKNILLAAAPALFLFPLAARAQASDPNALAPKGAIIRVSGSGSIHVRPDIATLTVGVTSEDADPKTALAQNNAATGKVIAELTGAGIDKADLRTANFSIYSQMRTDPDKRQTLVYRVSNTVNVNVRKLETLGDILSKLVGAGSNQIAGPTFSVSAPEKALTEARKLAVQDAQTKAQTFAAAAGLTLGQVLEMSDDNRFSTPLGRPQPGAMRMMDAVPIETGQESIDAHVTVVFQLNGAK